MNQLEDSAIAINESITAPLVWNSPPYYEILDLKENRYEETIKLIKEHYFENDPMCRATNLMEDSESETHYLELIRIWIKDTTSLIAISKTSGEVIGTIVTRINSLLDKTNTYSRVNIFQGNALNSIMSLKSSLIIQSDAYKVFDTDNYLRIYLLCVHPSYEAKNLRADLLYASLEEADTLNLKAVAGIFTSTKNQEAALKIGLKCISKIQYSDWMGGGPEIGDNSVAFMGRLTPNRVEQNKILKSRKKVWKIQNKKTDLNETEN